MWCRAWLSKSLGTDFWPQGAGLVTYLDIGADLKCIQFNDSNEKAILKPKILGKPIDLNVAITHKLYRSLQ